MKKYPIFLLIILVFACKPKAEQGRQVEETVQYEEAKRASRGIVQDLMKKNKTPGMAVAVAVDGEMVWSEGFGFSDMEESIPVDPEKTKFRIGSVSKTLTASAMGLLIERGKLDINKEVQDYVSAFPNKKYSVTVKQIGGHIGGIRHYRGNEMNSDVYYPTVTEGLDIFNDDPLLFEPGTRYSYSSYGWNLLSAVIESASDREFLSYMSEEVFASLGMENTEADIAINDIENRSKFYFCGGNKAEVAGYVDNSYKWAGGGFISSVEDLIIFGIAHEKAGFLKQETLDILKTPQTLKNGKETGYGIGWSSGEDSNGNFFVGHSGGSVGGVTMFKIYPNSGVIIAMVSNCSPLRYNGADHRIAALFMED